jgi:hypothetical protein
MKTTSGMPSIDSIPIARSKPSMQGLIFMVSGGLFFSFMATLSLRKCIVNGYPQLFPFLFGSIFVALAILCFVTAYIQTGYFEIHGDRIIVFSFFKTKIKTLLLKDVVKAVETVDENGNGLALTVRTTKSKYNIGRDDNEYDYNRIKETIKKSAYIPNIDVLHSTELRTSGESSTRKVMLVFYTLALLLYSWLIYSCLSSYLKPNSELNGLKFKTINGQIIATPETHKGSGRGDYSYVRFELRNHPRLLFEMENSGYHATYKDELYNIKPNDSVFLKISLDDYQKKISGEKRLTISDKLDASNLILVYEFWDKQYKYLSLDNYRAANAYDGKIGFYLSFLFMGLLIWTARKAYRLYRNNA